MTETADDRGATADRADGEALTHLRADGAVHMVDVGDKAVTKRTARATATLVTTPEVVRLLVTGELPKGEAFAVARIAGIMAAKQTSTLIALCHPLPITGVDVSLTPGEDRIVIETTVKTNGVTGVEMEALTAASVAALNLYDMVKAVDRAATITDIAVLEKHGGRRGDWERQ
jgi:cyclic pyranopterin phosphate synthase